MIIQQNFPSTRQLRGYAIDPTLSLTIDTVEVNNTVYEVDWEDDLKPGPIGEYIEVIDYDPTTGKFYEPVDLNHPAILASDGITPSESNPQFHQQMVYAVAMLTIRNFERALGRKIMWSPRQVEEESRELEVEGTPQPSTLGSLEAVGGETLPANDYVIKPYEQKKQAASPGQLETLGSPETLGTALPQETDRYVQRLRLYPHALREANAYYSPQKKAILFGYFAASPANIDQVMPGSLVFTCLSHDIIAHEMTHAILDGLNRYYNRPTNPDALAFHEAFADIVALFQHFTFPDLLRHQIARTRGQLDKQNMLGQLAQQFGTAIGQYGSLRDALGKTDPVTKEWIPAKPDPQAYLTVKEPHKRGSILVAAVFEAFLSIYKRRVADLLRIASGGTGVLAAGELHPDLVNRLADEAAKSANHTLTMCIRAIDYCPPVDLTFGDFLRAIITADSEMVASDSQHYRLAFIDAFRRRGIYPEGIKTLSEESLRFLLQDRFAGHTDQQNSSTMARLLNFLTDYLKTYRDQIVFETNRREIFNIGQWYVEGQPKNQFYRYMGLYQPTKYADKGSYDPYADDQKAIDFENLTGIAYRDVDNVSYKGFQKGKNLICQNTQPVYFKIVNLRLVAHQRADGKQINHIIFNLVQALEMKIEDQGSETGARFEFLAGCTLIFDVNETKLKYVISKPLLLPRQPGDPLRVNKGLIQQQRSYHRDELGLLFSESQRYFYPASQMAGDEPFALLHLQ